MKKRVLILLALASLLLAAPAYGLQAVDYFNLGLKSSMAYKKIEYFTKALELDPGFAPAYAKRGLLYYFQEKYDKVILDFENYTRLVPGEADAFRMLGMGHLKMGSLDAAISNFTQALDIDPNLAEAYCYRAEACRVKGYDSKALYDANRALELGTDPRTLAAAYLTRSKVYRKLGMTELADADMKMSVEIDPRYFLFRYISGYASLEDVRGAGLFGIIVLSLVVIFKLAIPKPDKDQ